ncbi:MAG: 4Fe-4S dicluster domain-containing protein [Deltaproteobacteria bacterium]|nr:4Fe-4S dicluster domain-containing protein [Deltaproteobacteria bacterium]
MEAIRIQGGHRFRLKNRPATECDLRETPTEVAFSPRGIADLKARVLVKEGDAVKCGQIIVEHKRNVHLKFAAPAAGKIKEIKYGPHRRLDAVIIEVDGDDAEDFGAVERGQLAGLGREKVVDRLVEAGLWHRLMAYPTGEVAPVPGYQPPAKDEHSEAKVPPTIKTLYVSACSTEPHQPQIEQILDGNEDNFAAGLEVLKQIPTSKTYLMTADGQKVSSKASSVTGVTQKMLQAKYPADNTGVQVYYTDSLGKTEVAVGLNAEDVIDIGHVFLKGKLRTERTYCIGGDGAKDKKHFRGHTGIRVKDLLKQDVEEDSRIIAGGLCSGDKVDEDIFLGGYDRSVLVMKEDRERTLLHFVRLGMERLSLHRVFPSGLFGGDKEYAVTTSNNGEERPCIQCGVCIDVCPVDLMPNLLFKAAVAEDFERMEEVGVTSCTDCGLCSFVCPSKIEIVKHIGSGKDLIRKEG